MGSGIHAVREDWVAQLTEEKGTLFGSSVMRLETSYGMLSVALNEAFVLRDEGELIRARAETAICGQLCGQLAQRLLHSLQSFEAHTRHFGTVPAVAPLETSFFRSEPARMAAKWNEFLHHVLFGARTRWFHKLRTLQEVVGEHMPARNDCNAQVLPEGSAARAGTGFPGPDRSGRAYSRPAGEARAVPGSEIGPHCRTSRAFPLLPSCTHGAAGAPPGADHSKLKKQDNFWKGGRIGLTGCVPAG